MLAIKQILSLGVVEAFRGRVPANHIEVETIVIGMALNACRPGRARSWIGGMQPVISLYFGSYLPVALHALE